MADAEHPPTPEPPVAPDRFGIWFSRLVQIAGLGVFIEQAVLTDHDRPWLLLFSVAMMLGGLGLQLVVRAIAKGMP